MKKIGLIVLAASLISAAVAIGAYKLLERQNDNFSFVSNQNKMFASNAERISSTGAPDFVQPAAAVSPAVVHIKTTYAPKNNNQSGDMSDMFEQFFGFGGRGRQMPRQPMAASGSGVILTPDGYIVTNNHVVDKADKIDVILSNRRKVTAKVIGKDANTDLALIKVDANDLPYVKMGNSDNVQVGEWVLAIGFPLDLQTTVTAGIVSAKARNIGILSQNNGLTEEEYDEYRRTGKLPSRNNTSIESFIQTDAAINPGNSGGALVNANGELIGINAAIASQSGRNEGYGFAIPINLAKKVLEDFKKFGAVKRGYVGVSFRALDADVANELKIKDNSGLYVAEVLPNGAAAAAGIKVGDIIKKVNGKPAYDSPDLQEKVGRMSPGDKLTLSVKREDGSTKDINVVLKGESSVSSWVSNKSNNKPTGTSISKLGASFEPASAALKAKYNIKNGAVVTNVKAGQLFDYWGVKKGLVITKVNGVDVNSAADIEQALPRSRDGRTTISGVSDDGTFTFAFDGNN